MAGGSQRRLTRLTVKLFVSAESIRARSGLRFFLRATGGEGGEKGRKEGNLPLLNFCEKREKGGSTSIFPAALCAACSKKQIVHSFLPPELGEEGEEEKRKRLLAPNSRRQIEKEKKRKSDAVLPLAALSTHRHSIFIAAAVT